MAPRLRTVRYARAWLVGTTSFVEQEVTLDRGDKRVLGTITRPLGARERLPAWVVLHGVTRRGRSHEQLQRFTRALVHTGAVAIVPEVPEWRDFDLAPRLAVPTIAAAIAGLRDSGWARDAPAGVIGFSFGAPHAIGATAHPRIADSVAGSVGFGGYCSMERTIRFLMTGEHEWMGRAHRVVPDAYGRWIVGANYLTAVPELADAADVASALRSLAAVAGDQLVPSLDPRLDSTKSELRAQIAEERRSLFDLFAPASHTMPEAAGAAEIAESLAAAVRRVDPVGEPAAVLAGVTHPVHVLHGRHDRLIPFSEGLRLRDSLPATTWSRATITRLFGHSGENNLSAALGSLRELPLFLSALRSVLRLV
jgi:pimeloyl-ACP methyl ester carboxylesterase